jgi:hypothetical protein
MFATLLCASQQAVCTGACMGPGWRITWSFCRRRVMQAAQRSAGDEFSSLAGQRDLDSSQPRDTCHRRPRHVAVQTSTPARGCHYHSVSSLDILLDW